MAPPSSSRPRLSLPKHYYLNILGLAYRIGCAEVYRHKERIGVRFINIMDPEVLRRVVRTDFLVGNMEAIAARRAPIFRA